MPYWVAVFVGFVSFSSAALAADEVKMRPGDLDIHIQFGEKGKAIELSEYFPYVLENIRVLDKRAGASGYFVLIEITGLSRDPSPGHCGAGEEKRLVWLALSPALEIDKGQSEPYESCIEGVYPQEPLNSRTLSVVLEGPEGRRRLFYDVNTPEKGLLYEASR